MTIDFSCPVPDSPNDVITMAQGSGGRAMQQLVEREFSCLYDDKNLLGHDSAVLPGGHERIAMTTDSYVVDPLFFPGGDIGKLAVYGTVNDLAMAGAEPRYLSVGFILEEGLPMATLRQVLTSMRDAARVTGISIVTGDTKVVERGKADKLYINTAGVGTVRHGVDIHPDRIEDGDAILVSGDIGRHGVAVMAARQPALGQVDIASDCAPLHATVRGLLDAGIDIHCLRDLTRGGLAAALGELATARNIGVVIEDDAVPIAAAVADFCDLLGVEPVHVANEGRFICIVPELHAEPALAHLRAAHGGEQAARVGTMVPEGPGIVRCITAWGSERLLPQLSGDPLPRIC